MPLGQCTCKDSREKCTTSRASRSSHAKNFNIIEETEDDEGVMLLQINQGNVDTFDAEKATPDVKNE